MVDFYANWCEPCKVLDAILSQTDAAIGNRLTIIKVNADLNAQLCSELQIRSVPVLFLYKNASLVWRYNGFPDTEELIQLVSKFADDK